MKIPSTTAVARYQIIRDELREKFPKQWDSVVDLCSKLPLRIDVGSVWMHGRDKPCWSNIKVTSGEKIAADLKKCDDFESFEIIASDAWEINMLERGSHWKRNDNFELKGESVRRFVDNLPKGGLSSYLWRLYAIRNLAIALTRNENVRAMIADLGREGVCHELYEWEEWSKDFSRQVGMGWGYITAYHMLTDLGLTPKPDIWLSLSAVRMGLLEPDVPSDSDMKALRNFEHQAVRSVIALSGLIEPAAFPQDKKSALREVDKVLMEWGRQGLSRPM